MLKKQSYHFFFDHIMTTKPLNEIKAKTRMEKWSLRSIKNFTRVF